MGMLCCTHSVHSLIICWQKKLGHVHLFTFYLFAVHSLSQVVVLSFSLKSNLCIFKIFAPPFSYSEQFQFFTHFLSSYNAQCSDWWNEALIIYCHVWWKCDIKVIVKSSWSWYISLSNCMVNVMPTCGLLAVAGWWIVTCRLVQACIDARRVSLLVCLAYSLLSVS